MALKVFLRLGRRPHPLYYELVDYPPKGVQYVTEPFLRHPYKEESISLLHKLKVKAWSYYTHFKPNAFHVDSHDSNLVYMTNNMMATNREPWIMDLEHVLAIAKFDKNTLHNPGYKRAISRILSSPSCKRIMPYTDAAIRSFEYVFPEKKIREKLERVYLARHATPSAQKRGDASKIRLLFPARRFYEKGGLTVLRVFKLLEKKYDVELMLLAPIPEDLRKKYASPAIKVVSNVTHDATIWDSFKASDVLFYPTNLDSYGMALLDAMNYRLPIVTTNTFAVPEVVEDGKTGFVAKHPLLWHDENFQLKFPSFEHYVERLKTFHDDGFEKTLAEKLSVLIEDGRLRRRMGGNGRNEIEHGKFSIGKRNSQLKKIYEEAASS